MEETSYAPESPDLTAAYPSYEPEPLPLQHQGYRGSISHSIPYTPIETDLPQQQYFASSHHQLQSPLPLEHPSEHYQHAPTMPPRRAATAASTKEEYGFSWMADGVAQDRTAPAGVKAEGSNGAYARLGFENIEVRTKFPVARIKRIMQADDDVGKVAQVTPVVVSKALELFMISLVTKAAAEAKSRSSKRVSALHLKQAITKDEQFDFLVNIVGKVPEAAAEKHDDDHPGEEKKRKPGGGRKKKKGSDEE